MNEKTSDEDIINKSVLDFFQAAKEYWRFIDQADSRSANRQHAIMKNSYRKLSETEQRNRILSRLQDPDPEIALAVASHCIQLDSINCLVELQKIEAMTIPPAAAARILVDLWSAGRL
jgi:hypothetical protein